jgi:hypothetical protein
MEAPFILDRNHATLMDGKAGMQIGNLREKATSRLRTTGRQAGKQVQLEGRTHLHKSPCSLQQKF